jgi:hypothetical protein
VTYRRMFSGERGGDLCPLHISFRAGDVRESIARLFADDAFPYSREARAAAWRRAKREGWRVVPVRVEKITTPADKSEPNFGLTVFREVWSQRRRSVLGPALGT